MRRRESELTKDAFLQCVDKHQMEVLLEKVDAQDRDGIREFSLDRAKEIVKEIVAEQSEYLDESKKSEVNEELELLLDEIDMDANDIGDVMRVAGEFTSDVIESDWFSDLWDHETEEYTYRFQWACFAIAWGY